jgi:3D-(3,5/4)-trihydroxycyclohexane-1,2-dione acylhydrolase (decyclizing)
MATLRLTMAQALVRFLAAQRSEIDGREHPLFAGVFAIFGHGNVAGLGEALYAARGRLPTLRAHNEQAMALAAVAHANRLPVLLLPGDIFAGRRPDPVLQQIEAFSDPTISVNDCFRPVSRWWDRITRPEQLLESLPQAMHVLTDPAECGPVTLALPQDVQADACDYPEEFFAARCWRIRQPPPDPRQLADVTAVLTQARRPLIIAGGGVHYALACETLADFAVRHGVPVTETQAGKGAFAWDHPYNVGAVGVTGGTAANTLAAEADVVLAVGTRLSDFTTASRSLFRNPAVRLIQLNVAGYDAAKHGALPLVADARSGLEALDATLAAWRAPAAWTAKAGGLAAEWNEAVRQATSPSNTALPSDAEVLGAVNRAAAPRDVVVCAAGGLPGQLHKLWRCREVGTYHVEYGYSCMGYEIAGGLGVKLALPDREVWVLVGDGSYLMMNSEIATSVALDKKLNIVVLDNGGFGCIERLQRSYGGVSFNNLFANGSGVDFAAHAASLGAVSRKVASVAELEAALPAMRAERSTAVTVIATDPAASTSAGGAWWDVAIPEVSDRSELAAARAAYDAARTRQRVIS